MTNTSIYFIRLPVGYSSARKKILAQENKKIKKENKVTKPAKQLKSIQEIANELVFFQCACKKNCLARVDPNSNWEISQKLLQEYATPWYNMTGKEHREKFFSLLEGCAKGLTPGGQLEAM